MPIANAPQGAERINFQLVSRGARMIADNLYANDFDTFRELTQNAFGAGARKITMHLTKQTVDFDDDGRGMPYTFVRDEWGKIGQKSTENEFGFFGFGRLSVFKIGDSVSIETETKDMLGRQERTHIEWRGLMDAQIWRVPPTGKTGTSYHINLSSDKTLEEDALRKYLSDSVHLPATLMLNGTQITMMRPRDGAAYALTDQKTDFATNSGNKASHTYDLFLHPEMSKMVVLEKGLKITEFDFPMGGYIDFQDNVKTASRGQTTINHYDLMDKIKAAYLQVFGKMNNSQLSVYTAKILDLAFEASWEKDKYKDALSEFIVIGDKNLSQMKKDENTIFYFGKSDSPFVELMSEEGYNVVAVEDKRLADMMRSKGIRELDNELVLRHRAKIEHRHAFTPVEQEMLDYAAGYLSEIAFAYDEDLKSARDKPVKESGKVTSSKSAIEESVSKFKNKVMGKSEKFSSDHQSQIASPFEVTKVGEGLAGGGVTIFIGKYTKNPEKHIDTVAWHIGNLGSGMIALNIDNEIIQMILAAKRFGLLKDILDHEFAHEKTLIAGHGDDFSRALTTIQMAHIRQRIKVVSMRTDNQSGAGGAKVDGSMVGGRDTSLDELRIGLLEIREARR